MRVRKGLFGAAAVSLAVSGTIAAAAPAATAQAAAPAVRCDLTVKASGLFIHSKPNASSTHVGETFKGYRVVSNPYKVSGGWVHGTSNGKTGWMARAYLSSPACDGSA